ncbi:MAG: hypothetical protein RL398_111 [Planctomycetota bacterium]|jgi:sec-independent protein translocase protein TatA
MFAFLPSIGFQEMVVLFGIGLLLYGRNLPEAGRTLGKAAAHLRRGFQEFKDQLDRDGDLKEVKQSLKDSARELRNISQVPGALTDPAKAARNFAEEKVRDAFSGLSDESLASELPPADATAPAKAPSASSDPS